MSRGQTVWWARGLRKLHPGAEDPPCQNQRGFFSSSPCAGPLPPTEAVPCVCSLPSCCSGAQNPAWLFQAQPGTSAKSCLPRDVSSPLCREGNSFGRLQKWSLTHQDLSFISAYRGRMAAPSVMCRKGAQIFRIGAPFLCPAKGVQLLQQAALSAGPQRREGVFLAGGICWHPSLPASPLRLSLPRMLWVKTSTASLLSPVPPLPFHKPPLAPGLLWAICFASLPAHVPCQLLLDKPPLYLPHLPRRAATLLNASLEREGGGETPPALFACSGSSLFLALPFELPHETCSAPVQTPWAVT